jgi:hypothetical protein
MREVETEAHALAPRSEAVPAEDVVSLIISVYTDNDAVAIRKINEIMRGHGLLRNSKMTASDREVSGKLPAGELQTLFVRLGEAGKVGYDGKKFEALSGAGPIPFVLKLRSARRAPSGAVPSAPVRQPQSGPTTSEVTATSDRPVSSPAASTAQ